MTEFTGERPKEAKVYLYEIGTDAQLKSFIKKYYRREIKSNRNISLISPKEYYFKTYQMIRIKGDFSKCLGVAQEYEGTNYGGYDLIENNCLHFGIEVLLAGKFDNKNVQKYVKDSNTIVPRSFFNGLNDATNKRKKKSFFIRLPRILL